MAQLGHGPVQLHFEHSDVQVLVELLSDLARVDTWQRGKAVLCFLHLGLVHADGVGCFHELRQLVLLPRLDQVLKDILSSLYDQLLLIQQVPSLHLRVLFGNMLLYLLNELWIENLTALVVLK